MQKPCPRCHTVKPAAAFYRDSSRPDGLSYYCRECTRSIIRRSRLRPPSIEQAASIEQIVSIEKIERAD